MVKKVKNKGKNEEKNFFNLAINDVITVIGSSRNNIINDDMHRQQNDILHKNKIQIKVENNKMNEKDDGGLPTSGSASGLLDQILSESNIDASNEKLQEKTAKPSLPSLKKHLDVNDANIQRDLIAENIFSAHRKANKITLEDVAEVLKIRTCYLQAIEDEDWGKLPERVYAVGFLNSYAVFLNIDCTELYNTLVDYYETDKSNIDQLNNEKLFRVDNSKEKIISSNRLSKKANFIDNTIEFFFKNNFEYKKNEQDVYKIQIVYVILIAIAFGVFVTAFFK